MSTSLLVAFRSFHSLIYSGYAMISLVLGSLQNTVVLTIGVMCVMEVGPNSGVASYEALGHMPLLDFQQFHFSSLWSKSDSQLSKYCVVCEIS